MSLTPQDIVRKEFREALRGYNQADVDLFLDEVVEAVTELTDENQKMKVRLAALQQEVARVRDAVGGAAASPVREGGDRVEAEVRARLRRFFEEQLRALDAAPSAGTSATVERTFRDVPPPRQATPEQPSREQPRQPFWAGE